MQYLLILITFLYGLVTPTPAYESQSAADVFVLFLLHAFFERMCVLYQQLTIFVNMLSIFVNIYGAAQEAISEAGAGNPNAAMRAARLTLRYVAPRASMGNQ